MPWRNSVPPGLFVLGLVILYVVGGLTIHALRNSSPHSATPRPSVSPTAAGSCSAEELRNLDYSRTEQGELAWADEFDGHVVNTRRWTVRDRTTLSFDQAAILARNVAVRDGALRIEARRESWGDRDYTTGYVDTIGQFSQRHGRWEIRARLPVTAGSSRGLWPAFWLRADDAPGEIDVMEAWGTPADHPLTGPARYAWNVHEGSNAAAGSESGRFHGWGATLGKTSLADDFHVFAVDWSPECLKFTLDGRVTGSVALDAADWLSAYLKGTVNIRLNLQVGSHYWGRVDRSKPELTRLPARLVVDYVHVFERR